MELNAIKLREGEKIVAVSLPDNGKMAVEDVANILNISVVTVKGVVKNKNIRHCKIGGKWIIDLADMWSKTQI